MTFWLNIDEG